MKNITNLIPLQSSDKMKKILPDNFTEDMKDTTVYN